MENDIGGISAGRKAPFPGTEKEGAGPEEFFSGRGFRLLPDRRSMKGLGVWGLLLLLFLGGCSAFSGSDTSWAKKAVATRQIFDHPEDYVGKRVIAGGVIDSIDYGKIVLRAFPLDGSYYPQTDKPPLGTVEIETGNAEPSGLYAAGNTLEVIGTVMGTGKDGHLLLHPYKTSANACTSALGLHCHQVLGLFCSCGNF